MTSMNISLPEALRAWVEQQIKGGRYGNTSEYVRELIRRDQERQAQERLEALIAEGIDSGPAMPMTGEDWDELKRRLVERHAKKRSRERA